MISFFITLFRLIKVIFLGIKNDKDFRFLFFFIIVLLISATVFYNMVEQWSVIDSLYFAVMTMSTIGYGDLVPTTDVSKVFTIIFTFLSIGSFVAFTAKSVQIILENHKDRKERIHKKFNKK